MEKGQKLISFCVPCYNSAKDMRKCLDSLLTEKDKVEIIIIDDGSKDDTPIIADEYGEKYPETVKVVHQPNGGHGAGINAAIERATGLYFKVVDSDDWVDQDGYKTVLDKIVELDGKVDLFVCNYSYYKVDRVKKEIKFKSVMKPNKLITWKDVKRFMLWENLTLHSTMYRTEILKTSNIHLPEHTFYEDNYFVYASLKYVKTLYYIPKTLYMYFIGREGQSVGKEQCLKRFRDHAKIAHLINNEYDPFEFKKDNIHLFRTMMHHVILINTIGLTYTRLTKDPEGKASYKFLLKETKEKNIKMYRRLRYRSVAGFFMVPGPIGVWLIKFNYWLGNLVVPFN